MTRTDWVFPTTGRVYKFSNIKYVNDLITMSAIRWKHAPVFNTPVYILGAQCPLNRHYKISFIRSIRDHSTPLNMSLTMVPESDTHGIIFILAERSSWPEYAAEYLWVHDDKFLHSLFIILCTYIALKHVRIHLQSGMTD